MSFLLFLIGTIISYFIFLFIYRMKCCQFSLSFLSDAYSNKQEKNIYLKNKKQKNEEK